MSAPAPCHARRGRSRPRRRGLLSLALALLASACAGPSLERRLEQEAARFVYVAPAPRVMAQARALLEERGYTVRADPTGRPVLSTPWKQLVSANGMASQVRRYLVAGKELGQGRMLVRIYSLTYTTVGTADAHPGLGSRSGRQTGDGSSGGGRTGFSVAGEGVSAAKGWQQRDLALEWRLFERLEPELAQVLRQEAAQPAAAVAAAPPTASRR